MLYSVKVKRLEKGCSMEQEQMVKTHIVTPCCLVDGCKHLDEYAAYIPRGKVGWAKI
jgi:hypothetical protein